MGYRLASVEDVRAAVDAAESTQVDALIARHLQAASDAVESLCARSFTPTFGTRYFPWPHDQMGTSWRLWLDADELAELPERVEAAGTEITDYFMEPAGKPPFNRLELNLASASDYFSGSATHQRAVAITGWFGFSRDTEPLGQLVDTIADTATSAEFTATPRVGQLLVLGEEYAEVAALDWAAVGVAEGGLADDSTAQTLTLGAAIGARPGELLLVGAELVRVRDVAGSTLIVERAAGGSTLAGHLDGAVVYAKRAATLARGVCGSTATAHLAGTAVAAHVVPEPVRSLVIAETLWRVQRDASSWAPASKVAGGAFAAELERLRSLVRASHGRNLRKRVI